MSTKSSNFIRRYISILVEPVIGYTRVVFATKFLLSFIAISLILLLITLPFFNKVQDNFRITFSSIEGAGTSEDPKMINPRFQGVDKDDQTYNITADSATKKKDNTLILNNIHADINLRNESWIAILANIGILQHNKGTLDLLEAVSIFTHEGYEFYTDEMYINIKDNTAYSATPIRGQGPIGTLTANNLLIKEKGEHIIMGRGVKVILYPTGYNALRS